MDCSGTVTTGKTEQLKKLQSENTLLLEENRKVHDTIGWMHDTIWHLIRTKRTDVN